MSTSSQPLPFADLLRRYRLGAGLTQEQLAEAAGLGVRGVSDLERGMRTAPRTETVRQLADALGLSDPERAAFLLAARHRRHPAHAHPRGLHPTPGSTPSSIPSMASSHWPPPPPLVGRARELARIERLLSGEGAPVLLLAGEPGIGKSRLLEETERLATERGWRVQRGGCTRRSGQEPYAPLVGALASSLAACSPALQRRDLQGCAWLVRLLPELAEARVVPAPTWTLPPEQERRLMVAAVGRYLANIAGPAGTVLLLDDLQWAGADALDLLATLARAHSERSLRLIGAYRDTEVRAGTALAQTLADLARDGLVERLPLAALPLEEARTLLAHVIQVAGSTWGEELTEQVVHQTGGVPYFLVSCAQSLHDESGAATLKVNQIVPWNVSESIRQRVAALPESAQQLLRLAAVVGRETESALLLEIAGGWGWQKTDILTALETACQERLLVEAGGAQGYRFAHDLVREAVFGDLSGARRADLHLQVAQALQGMEGLPQPARARRIAELAWHFQEAHQAARALPYALRAGDQAAAVYAHAEAERHCRTALELAGEIEDKTREAEALEKLGRALRLLGRGGEALEILDRAADAYQAMGDTEGERRALAESLHTLSRQGKKEAEAGLARVRPLLQDLETRGEGPASPGLAALYVGAAWVYAWRDRWEDLLTVAARLERLAQALHDEALLARAHHFRATGVMNLGSQEEALALFEALISVAEHSGDERLLSGALSDLMLCLKNLGEFARMGPYAERKLEVDERIGEPVPLAVAYVFLGSYAFLVGDWPRSRALYLRCDAIVRRLDDFGPSVNSAYAPYGLGQIELGEGRAREAELHLEQALALAQQFDDLRAQRGVQLLLAERDLLSGRAAVAHARLVPLLDQEPGKEEAEAVPLLPLVALAELEMGTEDQAASTVEESVRRATRQAPRALADALRVRALLAIKRGDWQAAQNALEETLSRTRAMPYPWAEAKALFVYGQLLAAQGEPERAREQYTAALAICARLSEGLYLPHIEHALAKLAMR